ncbi:MAG TPA: hypothetical protein VF681_13410 [Abditibacteriaceae bacterium]|jgi:hypothetical protein
MPPFFLLCPRCHAKNTADAARCYACAASLQTDNTAPDDIPDPLLEQAAQAIRETPAAGADPGERMGVAVAGTLGILLFALVLPVIVFFLAPWVYLLIVASPLPAFLCYLTMVVFATVGLWVWALTGKKG